MEEKECDNVKETEKKQRDIKVPNEKPNSFLSPDCLIPMTEKQTNIKKKKTRMRHIEIGFSPLSPIQEKTRSLFCASPKRSMSDQGL